MNMDTSENQKMHESPAQVAASDPQPAQDPAAEGASGALQADPGVAGAGVPPSAGTLLARARDGMGLSVGEVANHLKLSIRQVEALEADAFDRLPSPMFVRGFARSYARLVHVDPAAVLQALDLHFPPPPAGVVAPAAVAAGHVRQPLPSAIPFPTAGRPSRWMQSAAGLLAAIVVGFLAFEWFGPVPGPAGSIQGTPGEPSAEVLPSGTPPRQSPLPGSAADATGTAPGADAAGATVAAADAVAPAVAAGLPATGTPVGASSTAPSQIGDAFGTGPRTVRLSFDRESWVEIRDARGRLIFSQLNPPGSSQVVQGEAPLSLVVGNARSVRLAYGDRDIDLAPHTRVDVARFTLD